MLPGVTAGDGAGARIDVAICLDEALLLPAAVLLQSIAEHAQPERPVRVHALTTFATAKLSDLAPPRSASFELCPTEVDNRFAALPRNDYISQGTYLRFLLPDLLADLSRLVYLDVDMVVTRDLAPLQDLDLHGLSVGAATDIALNLGSTRWDHFDLDYDGRSWRFADYVREVLELADAQGDAYFNAGLLVIDLDAWRRDDIVGQTLGFIARKPGLKFMDQDALSHVMQSRYLRVDPRWNAMASEAGKRDGRLRTRLSAAGRRWERARALWRDTPWIVHYAGPHKPWHTEKPVAHGDLWWAFARRSRAWTRLEPAHGRYRAVCRAAEARDRPPLAKLLARLRGR